MTTSTERPLAGCCSSRAPRFPSAPTAIRKGWKPRSKRAWCAMPRAPERWIADVLACRSRAWRHRISALLRRLARATRPPPRAGTRSSSRRARPRSCAQRPRRWVIRCKAPPRARLGEVPLEEPRSPAAFAFAAAAWRIDPHEALVAYLWAWIENQVLAAVKRCPRPDDGQRLLVSLARPAG